MNTPIQPKEDSPQLVELRNRVKKLEDEVFKGGPPGFGEQLKQLGDELAALQNNSSNQIYQLDQKIDQVIRIVAELRQIVEGGRAQTASY